MLHPLYEKYQKQLEVSYWLLIGTITALVNSFSVLDDYKRRGLSIERWQPFVWEFSSQISIFILIPILFYIDKKHPINISKIKQSLLLHLPLSIAFSVLHVYLMIALRHFYYYFSQSTYDFGDWSVELIYEYRKDLGSYISILATFYIYRFIISRLRNEAREIEVGEGQQGSIYVERLIVKKIGKEFIIRVSDIAWVEASGNYMNLHIGESCYPIRTTMADLEKRLDPHQFVRIHRSTMVNLDLVKEIIALETGDFLLTLNNGRQLKLSRRYRDEVNTRLAG